MRYFFIYEDDRYIVLFIDRKVSRHYIYRYLCKLAEGDSYVEACAWLAAHLMTVAALDDGAEASSLGGVSERKAGDLSVKYAASSSSSSSVPEGDQSLVTTRYGREFIALRNTCPDSVANVIAIGGEYAS